MKKLILIPLIALCGCSSTNITKLTTALAQDPAIVSLSVTTIYGNIRMVRVGGSTNQVSVTPDGSVTINQK